jgi:hypothetical protein
MIGRASLLLVALVTTAAAQDDADHRVSVCQTFASASRTRVACGEEDQKVLRSETELTLSLEIPPPINRQCETKIDLEYSQRDTIARATGVIKNETCAASEGQYEIEARIENENGESQSLIFEESWQRDDDQPVEFTADYPIGENVELIRLRSRGLSCSCVDPVDE